MRTLASPEKATEAVRVADQLEGMSPEEAQKMAWGGLWLQPSGAVLPFMAISAATGGWGGFAVFTLDYAEQNRRDLRQMGLEDAQATELGAIAAPVQAAAESLSNLFQLGRFTKLQSVLSRFNKPLGGGWAAALRYGQHSALNLGVEFSEEQLQDNFAVPMVQEIVGALREDVPEVDWSFYGNRAVEQTPQLLSVLTPMALVFGGMATSAQVRLSKNVTESIDHLKAVGMSDSQALEIAALPKPEDRIQRGRELWDAREGTPQSMEEAAQTVAKNLQVLSRDADARLKDLERRGILPPMLHAETDRWQLTFGDGSRASFGNHAEADAARWHWVEDQLGKVHQATRAALSQMEHTSAVGREIAVEFKPTVLTTDSAIASGLTTAAQMQRRLQQSQAAGEIAGAATETETYEATLAIDGAVSPGHTASLQILGSSSNQFKNDILRTTIKLYQGHHVLTLVEEKLEGDAKAILATPQGRAWMTERLRAYEAASGDRLLRARDDSELETDDLVEAWSSLGQSYLVGRSKKGSAIGQGGSRKIFADVLSAGLGGALNAETQFFHSVWRRAAQLTKLKREGKLGTDLEAELSKQLGLEPAQASEGWLAEQEGGLGTNGDQRASEDPSFAVRVGASLNSQKKEIPKTTDKMPRFPIHGEFNKALAEVVAWMKANPTATTPDGKTILIANPEGGSLEKRAEHWMASYKKDDKWQRDGRQVNRDKVISLAAIPTTLQGAQVEALSDKGSKIYLRRYADNLLHAVFVDHHNRVTEHGLVNGGVVTQFTLDPKRGIEGAVIVNDWTEAAPAYSVNPAKGAESDRVSTPGPPPSDQQGDTSAPTAHSYLNAEGALVKTPPNSSADETTPSDETFSLTYRARQKAQDQLAQQAIESILHHEQSRETNSRSTPAGLRSDGPRGDAQKSADTVTSALLRGSEGSSLGWHRDGGRGRRRDFEVAYLNRQATLPHDKGEKLGSGGEHTVHHRDGEIYVTKATHSGKYGQVFDQMGPDEGFRFSLRSALPSEYLFRLGLANKVFGDDVRVIGYERTADGPAIITTQSHLEGPHPRQEEVDNFLRFNGFSVLDDKLYDTKTIHETKRPWYRDKDGVVVVDAKRQNFVMHNGKVTPVDLMIQILPDEVLEKTRAARVK